MKTENLMALRDFLMTTEVAFSMANYRQERVLTIDEDGDKYLLPVDLLTTDVEAGIHACNTAGCALGWAPFVVPPKSEHYRYGGDLDFLAYAEDMLIEEITNPTLPTLCSDAFISMFDAHWSSQDDTAEGAAFRINAFLQGKLYTPHQNERNYRIERDRWVTAQRAAKPS